MAHIDRMPGEVFRDSQGTWAVYGCSLLFRTKAEAMAHVRRQAGEG